MWNTERTDEIVTMLSPCRLVLKAGRVTVEHARSVAESWRQAP